MALITIARGALGAATQLGGRLAEALSIRVLSREDVYAAAKPYGIEKAGLGDMSFIDERPPSAWRPFSGTRDLYLACFKAALFDLALSGEYIYIGHLAHLLLSEYRPVLRLRLSAPDAFRVASLERDRGMTKPQAAAYIREIDERRLRWAQFLYGVDWREPCLYDLVLNPEKLGLETMTAVVTTLARSAEMRTRPEDQEKLRNLRLAAVARAVLLRNGLDLPIDADAATGRVRVFGESPSVFIAKDVWEHDIHSTLEELPDVVRIEVVPEKAREA